MDLARESGLIYERVLMRFADVEEIISWADKVIEQIARPPYWLIRISTDSRARVEDLELILRNHASELTRLERLKITIREHEITDAPLEETLSRIFTIWCPVEDIPMPGIGDLPDDVIDLLIYMDCWESEPPKITEEFAGRCKRAFSAALNTRS